MEKEIGKIPKGEYQGTITEIVVGIKEFNERVGIDIREFTQSEQYTGPTKKGLRIPADKFEDFKKMINSINTEDLAGSTPEEPRAEPAEIDTEEAGIDKNGLM
jgi:hypothetical protein